MIYYTADLHLGYAPMLAHRPFESVQEMDETLIRNWNETVGPDDTVYIVGDFSYNGGVVPAQYFRRLQGHKHLIRGNHDTGLENAQALFEYCESVVDYWELDDGEEHIILCHYPMIYEKRGYMIHGHLHAHRGRAYTMLQQLPKVLNCGVDVNFLRPVTLAQLVENNALFYGPDSLRHFPEYTGKPVCREGLLPRRPDFRPLPQRERAAGHPGDLIL